jgi:excisionase family DNA binding protein
MMDSFYQISGGDCAPGSTLEKLLTFKEAANAIGAKEWQVRRAVKAGRIPVYTPFNSRRLVKLSEVAAYIDSCRQGGVDA